MSSGEQRYRILQDKQRNIQRSKSSNSKENAKNLAVAIPTNRPCNPLKLILNFIFDSHGSSILEGIEYGRDIVHTNPRLGSGILRMIPLKATVAEELNETTERKSLKKKNKKTLQKVRFQDPSSNLFHEDNTFHHSKRSTIGNSSGHFSDHDYFDNQTSAKRIVSIEDNDLVILESEVLDYNQNLCNYEKETSSKESNKHITYITGLI